VVPRLREMNDCSTSRITYLDDSSSFVDTTWVEEIDARKSPNVEVQIYSKQILARVLIEW
jgi:hypothetical protein